jgi:hypothetical protein
MKTNCLYSIRFLHGPPWTANLLQAPQAAELAVTASVRQKMENPADRASAAYLKFLHHKRRIRSRNFK